MQEMFTILAGVVARMALIVLVLALLAWPAMLVLAGRRLVRPAWRRLHGLRRAGGVTLRDGVRLTPNHTWLQPLGRDVVRVGLDDVGGRLFAQPSRVTTASVGTRVHAGDVLAGVAEGHRGTAILSPLDGTVRAVNRELREAPALLSADPYFDGWLLEVVADPGSVERVPPVKDPVLWMRREIARLNGLVEHELGLAAADGGEPHVPPMAALCDEQWARVAAAVLRPPDSGLVQEA